MEDAAAEQLVARHLVVPFELSLLDEEPALARRHDVPLAEDERVDRSRRGGVPPPAHRCLPDEELAAVHGRERAGVRLSDGPDEIAALARGARPVDPAVCGTAPTVMRRLRRVLRAPRPRPSD